MKKYVCASDSLRPGQLDRIVAKIKDRGTIERELENKMENKKFCCNCGVIIITRKSPPGPSEPPPYSCGKEECDKKRVTLARKYSGVA